MSVIGDIAPAQLAIYKATAQRKQLERTQAVELRREQAWIIARQAAQVLSDEYGANKIILYGSLSRGAGFHMRSDIDLAAWGIDEKQYYRIVSRLLDFSPKIEVNLVMGEFVSPALSDSIRQEGLSL